MKWEKLSHVLHANGESTLTYVSDNCRFFIESRKRAIPHANRSGSWMHTSYWLKDSKDGSEKEYYSLRDAKSGAEAKDNDH